MPPREPDRFEQLLLALRAATQPLAALAWDVPPADDKSPAADSKRLGLLRLLAAMAGRALAVRRAEAPDV